MSLLEPGCPRLVVLAGPAGSGRTRALADLHRDLAAAHRAVYPLRFYTDGALIPASVPLRPTGGTIADWNELPLGPRTGAGADPQHARRVAAAAAATVTASDGVVLVDDAQWADADAVAVLEAFLAQVAGPGLRCALAYRTPGTPAVREPGAALFSRLRRGGSARVVRLAPLPHDEVRRVVHDEVDAAPSAELLAVVSARSRRVRAAVHDVTRSLVADGSVQVVDRHAYLVLSSRDERHRQPHLLDSLRRLATDETASARAVAALHPLGPATTALVADALECSPARAAEHLEVLRAAGFLHRGRAGGSWRFLVPALGDALREETGPFGRRRLAALAVTAVWAGRARCDDVAFLTERIAEAGTLVPVGLARLELIARATRALELDPRDARRWWRAAAEIADDRLQWAVASLQECTACFVGADYGDCLSRVQVVLDEAVDHLPVEAVHHAVLMHLAARHFVGDVAGVEAVAAGDDPGARRRDDGSAPVLRALALSLLDRWPEACDVLEEARPDWGRAPATTAALGELLEARANLYRGRRGLFERRLATGGRWARYTDENDRRHHVSALALSLLVQGERQRCEELLAREGVAEDRLQLSVRTGLELQRGRPGPTGDVLDAARGALAVGSVHGQDVGHVLLCQTVATLLAARGRLAGARDLLERTRARRPALEHLLDLAAARIDLVLGDRVAAEERLLAGLARATEHGVVVGTDGFHAALALARSAAGDDAGARRHLADLQDLHRELPTTRAAMLVDRTRAVLDGDRDAARRCLELARDRDVPWDLATSRLLLVEHGLADPAELLEAYAVFADHGALLARAWTRTTMAAHGVAVPGRRVTVAENEQLLGVLVGEGIANRQAATVLRTSEKSVEGRLGRLFARTGHQSRVELAQAVRRGELEV